MLELPGHLELQSFSSALSKPPISAIYFSLWDFQDKREEKEKQMRE